MTNIRHIDCIDNQEIKRKNPILKRVFKIYIILALLSHVFVFGVTITYIIIWWKVGYIEILFARFLIIFRIFLLIRVLMISNHINIFKIIGVGKYYKIIRHFSYYPSLGMWLLIGFIDLYLIRWEIPFINILHFIIKGPLNTLQFPLYLILDSLYLMDFYITIYIVYYVGIQNNITKNLLRQKKQKRRIHRLV